MKNLLSENTLSLIHADCARQDGERRAILDHEEGQLVRDLRLESYPSAADLLDRDPTPVAYVRDFIEGYRVQAAKF